MFFLGWIGLFVILYKILGVEGSFWSIALSSWQIGIGSGDRPESSIKNDFINALMAIVYVMNQYFLVIVMLNFLIAIIS